MLIMTQGQLVACYLLATLFAAICKYILKTNFHNKMLNDIFFNSVDPVAIGIVLPPPSAEMSINY